MLSRLGKIVERGCVLRIQDSLDEVFLMPSLDDMWSILLIFVIEAVVAFNTSPGWKNIVTLVGPNPPILCMTSTSYLRKGGPMEYRTWELSKSRVSEENAGGQWWLTR